MNMIKSTKPVDVPTMMLRGRTWRTMMVASVQRTKSRTMLAACRMGRRRMLKKRSSCFKKLSAPLVALILKISRYILNIILSTHGLIMPKYSLHLNEVNNTLKILLCANRHLKNNRVCAKDILHLLNSLKEVSTRTVHLIYISDTRYIIFVGLTPNGLRLGLYTVCS